MTRIAVIDKMKCNPQGCGGYLCMKLCPVNRTGVDCISTGSDKKPVIGEAACTGCGICPNRCPFGAISIVNLPEELESQPIHRYGINGFALYNLPIPVPGKVVGIIGRNGMGKSTALKILAGILQPNLGIVDKEYAATPKELIEHFKGTEAQKFFEQLRDGTVKVSFKPQQVDLIPSQFTGTVRELLKKVDEKNGMDAITQELGLTPFLDTDIKNISGGELQRVAIAATVLKKANVYFFDEPTAYLDIKQRLKVAEFIKKLADAETSVLVIEHDLIILDYMTDQLHLMYGIEGTYGVVSGVKSTKNGINVYLEGFLKEENIRFRDHAIKFDVRPPSKSVHKSVLATWTESRQQLGRFSLDIEQGSIAHHTTVGIVGENGIGKTTFVRTLSETASVRVSYKPQYLEQSDEPVLLVLHDAIRNFQTQLIKPLGLQHLLTRKCSELSGGELQRVFIAKCLSRDAELFLLDEPSAYLDIEQRLAVSKIIRDMMFLTGKSCLVVDHDLLFIDYISDELMVFDGQPAIHGIAKGPFGMEQGMNLFLADLDLSFRRDEKSHCPRTNKKESQMDRQQKHEGKLYYA
ncbi:MAG: ribosome biogenesis/translation initiation ATPase RLI [archaeon]